MVCPMILVPLFLIPIVNLLPRIFHYFMVKVYAWLGWEYRTPARAPPTCPIKPSSNTTTKLTGESGSEETQTKPKVVKDDAEMKQD